MSSMKDREEGFERKFVFDEELRFKANARRNKALGLIVSLAVLYLLWRAVDPATIWARRWLSSI